MRTIVLTGGGTAGHIMPHVALIPELKKHFDRIVYLGSKNGMEKDIITNIPGIEFIEIETVKLIRKLTLKNLLIPYKLIKSINQCKKILKKVKPNIIFSKGGFVSVPVCYAGKKLGIKIISHESDYSFGLANKLILRKCNLMLTSFRETCKNDNCIYTGSPIRDDIFKGDKKNCECGFKKKQPCILIFGGSLGAKKINEVVFKSIDKLKDFNIIHIVGKNNSKSIEKPNYFQIEFAKNIWDYFNLADLVVSRAGANSIFEILALKKPMLLIPLGKTQSRGDQIENAEAFKRYGFASVLYEEELTPVTLFKSITNLNKNKERYIKRMEEVSSVPSNKLVLQKILDLSK